MSAPTLSESIRQVREDLAAEGVSQVWIRRSFEYALATVVGALLWAFYAWVEEVRKQSNPLTATGLFLRAWGLVYGLTPTGEGIAAGTVLMSGNGGSTQPAGSHVLGPEGQDFTLDADLTLVGDPGDTVFGFANVTASEAGEEYNLKPATPLVVASPASGIVGTAQAWTISGGRTAEDDEEFRTRLLTRIQRPADVGHERDYERWTREASTSVTRVWVHPRGIDGTVAGTVLVLFAVEGAAPIPSGKLVTTVGDYIEGKRPAGAIVTVQAPTGQAVPFTIALDPARDSTANRSLATRYLRTLFNATAPGATVANYDMRAALARLGIAYQLQAVNGGAGTDDVTATSGLHLLYVGTITWGTWA